MIKLGKQNVAKLCASHYLTRVSQGTSPQKNPKKRQKVKFTIRGGRRNII